MSKRHLQSLVVYFLRLTEWLPAKLCILTCRLPALPWKVLPCPAGASTPPWQVFLHQQRGARCHAEGTPKEGFLQFSCKPTLLDRQLQTLCKNGYSQSLCKHVDPQIHDSFQPRCKNFDPRVLGQRNDDHEKHLQALCCYGDLDIVVDALLCMHAPASTNTYISLLRACNKRKSLAHLTSVHAHLANYCTELNGFLGDYLVLTLARCGAISDAYRICRTLPRRTVFSWTAIISAYADCACGKEALEMFQCMQEDCVEPNSYTFVSLFKACGSILDVDQGKKLHALAHTKGFTSNLFVGNTLVSMFGKCGAIVEAEGVFKELSERDVVSWNAMLSTYIDQDQGKRAFLLFRQMQEEAVSLNKQTLVLSLQACGAFVEEMGASGTSVRFITLDIGRALHAIARKEGYTTDVVVGTALLHMYGNCGAVMEAEDMFDAMSHHDIVSWTALLSAYLEQGQRHRALCTYRQMQVEGVSPNELTLVIALQACCRDISEGNASLEIGRALYTDARKRGYTTDFIVGNPLISMFGKFHGAIQDAENVFKGLSQRNIVSWNAMLSAYVDHGEVEKGLGLFKEMRKENVSLTDLSFIAILQDCSELGSLDFCRELHFDIFSTGYDHIPSVIATLIHAYGSCGSTVDAQAVLDMLSQPHIVSWNACVAGYARDGNHELSMHAVIDLALGGNMLDDATLTSILSACSHAGLVANGFDYFHFICKEYGVNPDVKHYGIMVDLLGRAGDLKNVQRFLERMPIPADLTLWLSLLSACRLHGNFVLAKQAYNSVLRLQPKEGAAYVLFANMHADVAWEDFEEDVEACG